MTTGRIFFPADLVDAANKAMSRRPRGGLPTVMPSRQTALRLTDVAFMASMQEEEGRRVSFRLAWATPSQFGKRKDVLHLKAPIELSVGEIAKLALACPPRVSMICIDGLSERPRIWGILNFGSELQDLVEGADDIATHPGDKIWNVRAHAPGELSVEIGNVHLARLRAGRIEALGFDVLQRGPVHERLVEMSASAPSWVPHIHALQRILRDVREARHGGAILLAAAGTRDEVLDFKYQMTPGFEELRLTIDQEHVFEARRTTLMRTFGPRAARPAAALVLGVLLNMRPKPLIRKNATLAFIAGLANVDGAVVMDPDLSIVGFGARIEAPSNGLVVRRALDQEGTVTERFDINARGMRHRSAAAFCSAVEGALAFVVSQDGPVTAMFRPPGSDAVLLWTPILLDHVTG